MVRARLTVLVLVPLGLGACDVSNAVIAPMTPVTIVHSVLNTSADTQYVMVEESYNGSPDTSFFDEHSGYLYLPWTPSAKPISGATVTLTHLDAPITCMQPSVRLSEILLPNDLSNDTVRTGVYATDSLCELRPGDRVQLQLVTPDNRVTTGVTRIPGVRSVSVRTDGAEVASDTLRLFRDVDSIHVEVEPLFASAMQVEVVRAGDLFSRDYPFSFVTDTLAATIAGDLILPLVGEDGQQLFQPGRYYLFTVAVVDTNYFDFARSGSDEFTARGFINHLEGGIGVFGSAHPHKTSLRVSGRRVDLREGRYQITGSYDGRAVGVTVDLFLHFEETGPDVDVQGSAIVEGTWSGRPISATANVAFGSDASLFGSFPMMLDFAVDDGAAFGAAQYHVFGDPGKAGVPFPVEVRSSLLGDQVEVLEMVQLCSLDCAG